ncbi:BTB/POZ domain-containing protein [Capsicum baccatum]|uniref:BTB/POZ domain-containing protein n=1 Tax=Capsicum baccatum TaxID=33114 RepID=A0A2G2WBS8_CAPBA|nr:BTB/POZ domain-containing protein [Capsicum baccatum]
MGVVTVAELKPSISGKKSFRPSSSARHITDWPIYDVSSDLTIEVGSTSFALHKFPLVSQSGRIRKLLLEANDTKVSRINLTGLPSGFDAFELASKFCYGVNVEITISIVTLLRCAVRFMKMTEDIFEKNLEIRTEGLFIKDPQLVKRSFLDLDLQKRQRIIVETIAELLPTQSRKSTVPMAFLSSLLKSTITASASTSCRSDLERRIDLQLDQAILEDILIPVNPHRNNHSLLHDIDSILRIFSLFLKLKTFAQEAKVYSLIALVRLLTYMQLLPHG